MLRATSACCSLLGTFRRNWSRSRPLGGPDGMRTIGKDQLLMAENAGVMSIVTFSGPQRDTPFSPI
jgi:hypothetical protein